MRENRPYQAYQNLLYSSSDYLAVLTADSDRLEEQAVQLIPGDSLVAGDRLDQLVDIFNGGIQVVVDDVDPGAKANLWGFHLQPQ